MSEPRTTLQIQIAVQENDPNITEQELRLCIEAQRNIEHFYRRSLIDLIEAIRTGDRLLKPKAEFAWGTVERMFIAAKKPPAEWLGAHNVPGHPDQVASLKLAKKIFEKATGEKL
jgi:hypothetical protein